MRIKNAISALRSRRDLVDKYCQQYPAESASHSFNIMKRERIALDIAIFLMKEKLNEGVSRVKSDD